MTDLQQIRTTVERFLVIFLWLHLPLIALTGTLTGIGWLMPTLGALVLAGGATVTARAAPLSEAARYAVAVSLMGMVALLVYEFDGNPWQIDIHMYFFATLAILTAYCCWRTLVVAAGAVAVHHLLLNFVFPAAVFPTGGDFGRVVLHAVIVVLQTAVLGWVAWRLGKAFSQSAEAVEDAHHAQAEAAEAARQRDLLTSQSQSQRTQEMTILADQFRASIGQIISPLSQSANSSRASAQEVDHRLHEMGERLNEAANSAQEVTGNVETVAAAAEELSASVREVNRFIDESSTMTGTAVHEVEKTNATVESLASAAHRIGDVVSLIQDIASQTNLLALNATIEAARAGEAGKGFAVVANEVKHLANQTAKATEEISAQIGEIQSVTGGAVAAIRDIGAIIGRIEHAVGTISHSASSQSQAIEEIARSAQRAAGVVETVSENVSMVNSVAQNLRTLSNQRTAEAGTMADQADGLARHVDDFISKLRRG
jgi:methyl-accepting chemotaxis protein